MKYVSVAGLAHSGWERFADALSAVRSKQLELFAGRLSAALRSHSSADSEGHSLLLTYGPPELAVAQGVRTGTGAQSALDAWKRDASDALAALDADPDGVLLVHGLAALHAPDCAAETLHLSLGVELTVERVAAWPDDVLPYLDAARRIAGEDDAAMRLYEDLEASALIASGEAAAVDFKRLNAVVFDHAAQRELDLKLIEGLVQRLFAIENGDNAQTLLRRVNGLRVKGRSRPVADLKAAVASVLKELAATQEALKAAELAPQAAPASSDDPPSPSATEAAAQDPDQQARREAAALAKALDAAAEDVRAAEREMEMLREATRLAIEDSASRNASPARAAAFQSSPEPAMQVPRRPRGLARWVWLARAYLALKRSELFDPDWYRDQYPDAAGVDVVRHYLIHGGLEGRSPSRSFCSATYLNYYPDVREAGLNPLAHYLLEGRAEGRYMFPALVEAST